MNLLFGLARPAARHHHTSAACAAAYTGRRRRCDWLDRYGGHRMAVLPDPAAGDTARQSFWPGRFPARFDGGCHFYLQVTLMLETGAISRVVTLIKSVSPRIRLCRL